MQKGLLARTGAARYSRDSHHRAVACKKLRAAQQHGQSGADLCCVEIIFRWWAMRRAFARAASKHWKHLNDMECQCSS
eukprot:5594989-Amphidinium_carterae.1